MSRSYKKNAVIKDHTKNMKRIFNKKVRKEKNIPNRAYYKKANCSYKICDFIIMRNFEDVLASFYEEKQTFLNGGNDYFKEKTYKEIYSEWYKSFKRK